MLLVAHIFFGQYLHAEALKSGVAGLRSLLLHKWLQSSTASNGDILGTSSLINLFEIM